MLNEKDIQAQNYNLFELDIEELVQVANWWREEYKQDKRKQEEQEAHYWVNNDWNGINEVRVDDLGLTKISSDTQKKQYIKDLIIDEINRTTKSNIAFNNAELVLKMRFKQMDQATICIGANDLQHMDDL